MDILIPDEWLRSFLKTKASVAKIAEFLSLSGPSVEKVSKGKTGPVYHIEVTTNRVDSASVYGIAREANAILPRYGINASLSKISTKSTLNFVGGVNYLHASVDKNLCTRFTAVLIKNVKIGPSPDWIKNRLEAVGVRPINNVIDISNYIMHEIGQPVHTFDYDKIEGAKMVLRLSKKGEQIKTLDEQTYKLPGGDIVIEDGKGRLIDLAGIMGGALSAVDSNTKNVLLFVQTYNPVVVRKTSMTLPKRTEASVLFEKDLDPENVYFGLTLGVELFKQVAGGVAETNVLDVYSKPYKSTSVKVNKKFIDSLLGVTVEKSEITKYLRALEFETSWKGDELTSLIPSFRAKDIGIPEDIVEEVARIYGYQNLPSEIMTGSLPSHSQDSKFDFENYIKNMISGWGGNEVYTLSLVSKDWAGNTALKLKNPLGTDTEYLRTSLMPSLLNAAKENSGHPGKVHLFEMANVYLANAGALPKENLTLAGVFSGYSYREAKGIIESMLIKLSLPTEFVSQDFPEFSASKVASIMSNGKHLGRMGVVNENLVYYEFNVESLRLLSGKNFTYVPISKYPSQIEDLTFILPQKTRVGDVLKIIVSQKLVGSAVLKDIYKDSFTFNVEYHSNKRTLTDEDVEKIRHEIVTSVKSKFDGILKG